MAYASIDTKRKSWDVVLVGAGGTGSRVVDMFTQLMYSLEGQKDILFTIYEGDLVESKNVLRQKFTEADVTYNKGDVLVNRYGNVYGISERLGSVPNYAEDPDSLVEVLKSGDGFPILVGAVDNNASRQVMHQAFMIMDNLFYIDAGNGVVTDDPEDNGKWTGQVVVGLKMNGKVILHPVAELYPDVLADTNTKLPSQSCGDTVVSEPQLMATNAMSAMIVFAYLNNIIAQGRLNTHATTFNVQNTITKPWYITEEMLEVVG